MQLQMCRDSDVAGVYTEVTNVTWRTRESSLGCSHLPDRRSYIRRPCHRWLGSSMPDLSTQQILHPSSLPAWLLLWLKPCEFVFFLLTVSHFWCIILYFLFWSLYRTGSEKNHLMQSFLAVFWSWTSFLVENHCGPLIKNNAVNETQMMLRCFSKNKSIRWSTDP